MKTGNAILVAEDNQDDWLLLQRALAKARVLNPIFSVHDGEETIAYLEGAAPFSDREKFPQPILLLLDLNMPKKSGYDVLEWLQSHSFLVKPLACSERRPRRSAHGTSTYQTVPFVQSGVFREGAEHCTRGACAPIFN